jgi:phosphorylated CTD-interacting factor 1
VNPPFDPGFVERLVAHLESVLSRSATRKTDGDDDDDDDDDDDAEALSFVVVVPYWPEKRAWLRLVNSEFARKVLKLRAGAHGFVAGAQHLRPDKVVPSAAATSVVFLQNDAGAKRWPVTSEKIDAVKEGFRGGLKARRRTVGRPRARREPTPPRSSGTRTRACSTASAARRGGATAARSGS